MEFYCGIDLGSRLSHLCVIDAEEKVVLRRKVHNDLGLIVGLLEPFKPSIRIVIESTFNWYWLVDGLMAHGFDVVLAHTFGLSLITGSKVKTDRRDAFALAKLLRLGAIPRAFIYPRQQRPARDLVRRRIDVVRLRAHEYASIRMLLLQHGLLEHTRYETTLMSEEELRALVGHPLIQRHARQQLQRIELYTVQIDELDRELKAAASGIAAYERLQTLPGVSTILGLTIYYETGSIERFANARHYSSYCRVVPGIAQSGNVNRRRGAASKQGNPYLKHAFSQAAVAAVRYYPRIRAHFERVLEHRSGRMGRPIAYNTVAHKLAVAAYHVMRSGAEYREELLFSA